MNTPAANLAAAAAAIAIGQAVLDDSEGRGAFYNGPYTWVYLQVRGILNQVRRDAVEER